MLHLVTLTPALGAEIRDIELTVALSGEAIAEIRAAWLEHLVLVFRGQKLSDAALVAFSRRFGELDVVPGWEPFTPHGSGSSNSLEREPRRYRDRRSR